MSEFEKLFKKAVDECAACVKWCALGVQDHRRENAARVFVGYFIVAGTKEPGGYKHDSHVGIILHRMGITHATAGELVRLDFTSPEIRAFAEKILEKGTVAVLPSHICLRKRVPAPDYEGPVLFLLLLR